MFNNAETVMINGKEVKSIVLEDGGVLYEKVSSNLPPTPPTLPAPPIQTEDIVGTITWSDENNVHKVRPETVTVTLCANGVETESQQVPTSPGNTITYTFEDQPVLNDNGDSIVYTVQEENINYYQATLSSLIITYRLIPKEPMYYENISGAITWVGDSASSRPSSVTVYLYRNEESIEQRIVTAATNWNYSFNHVPMDDGYGYYYDYSIRVYDVSGYASIVDGFNITLTSLNPIDDDDSGDVPTPPTPGDIPERT